MKNCFIKVVTVLEEKMMSVLQNLVVNYDSNEVQNINNYVIEMTSVDLSTPNDLVINYKRNLRGNYLES